MALIEESKKTSNARSSIDEAQRNAHYKSAMPHEADLINTEHLIAASSMIRETDKTNSV
jgi:hypothetical protein